MDMSGLSRNGPIYQDNSRNGHNMMVTIQNVFILRTFSNIIHCTYNKAFYVTKF